MTKCDKNYICKGRIQKYNCPKANLTLCDYQSITMAPSFGEKISSLNSLSIFQPRSFAHGDNKRWWGVDELTHEWFLKAEEYVNRRNS